MAITRALMKRQMYNMGGPTLQAGAPDLRLTGDQTHRGTYTQRRARQMAAGGGIMGSNAGSMLVAPTADGSRPGYWGLPDWIPNPIEVIKKVGQTIIPGGEEGYFDLYGGAADVAKKVGETIIPGGEPGYVDLYSNPLETLKTIGETIIPGGEEGYFDLYGGLGKIAGLGEDQYGKYTIPLAIGAAMGKLQQDYLDRQPKFPADQTSINFQTAAEAMADPNLRFKPQAQYANVAEGGRIGYDTGKEVIDYNKDPEYRGWRKMYELNKDAAAINPKHDEYKKFYDTQGQAQGGRIGYAGGGNGNRYSYLVDKYNKGIPLTPDETKELQMLEITYADVDRDPSAQGGRIGYANGGNGDWSPDWDDVIDPSDPPDPDWQPDWDDYLDVKKKKKKKRAKAQEGGLMDLGGMEKDYRQEGGFVPIGAKEKADDVPARLSKNEFVFTADAVRAAGGGDIDEGAKVMENLMENLEAGGKVSEESQGLEGAREMFANTQRLQNRII